MKVTSPRATSAGNSPGNAPSGGVWGTLKYVGSDTQMKACIACLLCCGPLVSATIISYIWKASQFKQIVLTSHISNKQLNYRDSVYLHVQVMKKMGIVSMEGFMMQLLV
mmetsp:Transcript_31145/g.36331  ORF Transcript_31145/g.36331 Transcript_31145/m.36331 type:complete len:109 (+) Transcript_31145:595-921(+)